MKPGTRPWRMWEPLAIIRRAANGEHYRAIGERYGVSRMAVGGIVYRWRTAMRARRHG
jgi:hypothetical protein